MYEIIAENSWNATEQKVYARRRKLHVNVKVFIMSQNLPRLPDFITLMQIISDRGVNHVHHFNIW